MVRRGLVPRMGEVTGLQPRSCRSGPTGARWEPCLGFVRIVVLRGRRRIERLFLSLEGPVRPNGRMSPTDLRSVFESFSETWSPRTVATMNNYDVRVVKMKGEFTRHRHPETDELFLVLNGAVRIRMDDQDVELGPGQLF